MQRAVNVAGQLGIKAAKASSAGKAPFEMQRRGKERAVFGSVRLGLDAVDADIRRQLYRQPLVDLQELASGTILLSSLNFADSAPHRIRSCLLLVE